MCYCRFQLLYKKNPKHNDQMRNRKIEAFKKKIGFYRELEERKKSTAM